MEHKSVTQKVFKQKKRAQLKDNLQLVNTTQKQLYVVLTQIMKLTEDMIMKVSD